MPASDNARRLASRGALSTQVRVVVPSGVRTFSQCSFTFRSRTSRTSTPRSMAAANSESTGA